MRTALLVTFTVILFTSCSKYQYYTLASDNTPKDQKQQFFFENDTCKISYNFSGARGPISISVYNKTNKPLQVDWQRSALIIRDSAISFFESEMTFSGEVERNRYSISQNVNGTITRPESIDFMPPQTSITKRSKYIRTKFIRLAGPQQKTKTAHKSFNSRKFTKENSPVAFRLYLTLISDNNSFNIDHSFYAAEIAETRSPPESFGTNTQDRFFIKGKTGFGQISTVVFTTGLVVLLIAAF